MLKETNDRFIDRREEWIKEEREREERRKLDERERADRMFGIYREDLKERMMSAENVQDAHNASDAEKFKIVANLASPSIGTKAPTSSPNHSNDHRSFF
jgi:hypothetical protein